MSNLIFVEDVPETESSCVKHGGAYCRNNAAGTSTRMRGTFVGDELIMIHTLNVAANLLYWCTSE